MILGCPIGSAGFMRERVEERVNKIEELFTAMDDIGSTHHKWTLARWTLNTSKLMHLIRSVPPHEIQTQLRRFDLVWQNAISRWIGMQLGPKQVEQLALPLDRGGLGIQSAVATGEVAFLASALSSLDLQKQLSGKEDYSVRRRTSLMARCCQICSLRQ